MVGLIIVCVMVFIAVFAPLLAPYDPTAVNPVGAFLKPGVDGHLLGTDNVGRDLLSRILYGCLLYTSQKSGICIIMLNVKLQ